MPKDKITDEQFITAYMASGGSYEGTARYIQENYNVPYTRPAALKRAKRYPDLQREVLELRENEFDDHLVGFAKDVTIDMWLRIRIYLQLKTQLHRINMKQLTNTNKKRWDFLILTAT